MVQLIQRSAVDEQSGRGHKLYDRASDGAHGESVLVAVEKQQGGDGEQKEQTSDDTHSDCEEECSPCLTSAELIKGAKFFHVGEHELQYPTVSLRCLVFSSIACFI